ncbi:hypothetical protein [Paraburkholderia sp. GAS42]|jgi:hypothetical protein|uniref:hypothetical protein n=1 Tax=Paraburkholderia sp. GAS42 TaxID=3035135 RepID=UPI003D1BCAE3
MAAAVNNCIDSYPRPDPRKIAEALRFKWGPLPLWLIEAKALDKTLYKAVKRIDKTEHLRLLSNDELKLRKTVTYRKWVKKLSQSIYHRETAWGVQTIHDASWTTADEFYWMLELPCFPYAIAEDPLITNDVYDRMANYALDIVLTDGLRQIVASDYSGPGYASLDEGSEYLQGTVMRISGDANEALDPDGVKNDLDALIRRGRFDKQFQALTEETKAVHAELLTQRLSRR